MTLRELREKYLRFFVSKGHSEFPSAPLVPIDVTGRLDESLLFTGAGMVQFKPYFRGIAKPENPCLTTCQRVVRTGDIETVGDPSHLTFFEMLGNFSFGDYFKAQAIAYSWEFMTSPEWLALDPNRLAFTVFEEDDEAYGEWERWLRGAGIEPSSRIFRLGEESNYWPQGAFSGGPPGPCGPNSEMFYWVPSDEPPPSAPYGAEEFVREEAVGRWREIWNDVFIQFEWQGKLRNPERAADGWVKDGMPPLPFQSVDTGMGLERTIATLNGHTSLYESDAFLPIFRVLHEIAKGNPHSAGGGDIPVPAALYAMSQGLIPEDEATVRAARIIADHIRTACFCIADGILPGNTGRGYVLRRLIRRAVLKGQRQLGFSNLFLYRVFDGVLEAMGGHYTELRERREIIVETLKNEEAQFRRTVREGIVWFHLTAKARLEARARAGSAASELEGRFAFPGDDAFRLYDTYGFPLEVTQELAEEAGLTVDLEGYERAMKEAQERSRSADGRETVYGQISIRFEFGRTAHRAEPTEFTGYAVTANQAQIVGAMWAETPPPQVATLPGPPPQAGEDTARRQPGEGGGGTAKTLVIALDQTPFYTASGGQIGDVGTIRGGGFELNVLDLVKQDGIVVHLAEVAKGEVSDPQTLFGQTVLAEVDAGRRAKTQRNHTATHLLHAALRDVLGKHVTQAGSYVGPDRLRFDFTHGKAMTPEEIALVEQIVNAKALENHPVKTYADVPVADAKAMGAMALFGEKYGDKVRVVQVGDEGPAEPAFSRELCGGTHVRATGEIGLFKIVGESSAASGVRRIEAVTGEGAYEWALEQAQQVREAATLLRSSSGDLVHAVERSIEQHRDLQKRLERMRSQASTGTQAQLTNLDGVELAVEHLTEGELKDATLVADRLSHDAPKRVTLVGLASDGKVQFVCKVGPEALAKGAHAGNLVREVAKIAGGGGGGKADFATAGGKQPEKVGEALAAAEGFLKAMLS